ncbi:MAG: trypsin-like serine protease [Elusimicrobiaceae bacterium]|nr:trypsin-like serine protease [Elusimicrobiaceae bacterium]
MNKHFLLACCALYFAVPVLAQVETENNLQVFNTGNQKITSVAIDHSLNFIDGNLPQNQVKAEPACIVNGENWEQRNPTKFPYSATVFLTLENGRSRCSGAMIGKYTVLTAAHCVLENTNFNTGKLRDPQKIEAFAGGDRSALHAHGANILIPEQVRRLNWGEEFIKHDYAIIVLDEPLGEKTGYFGVQKASVSVNESIAVLGFPGRRDHTRPWYSPGKVLEVAKGVFYHDADILPGNSGGPTVKSNNLRNIIGVVSFEDPFKHVNGSSKPADQALVSFVAAYRNLAPIAQFTQPVTPPHIGSNGKNKPPLQLPPEILEKLKRRPRPGSPNTLEEIKKYFNQTH